MSEVLHEKYRPQQLAYVIGQDDVVQSLGDVITNRRSQAFLFTGPSGTGKTTMARIAAMDFGCVEYDIQEIDAATYTGIDAMRAVTEALKYRPRQGPGRAMIIDEAHRLSSQAWESLLKSIEEPPLWAYWFFCTTDMTKVPKTVVTRCTRFDLKLVPWQLILSELLAPIATAEGFTCTEDILGICAREANGSPRQALVNLAMCCNVQNKDSALRLLQSAEESTEAVELARILLKGGNWTDIMKIVGSLSELNPESVRHVVRAYMTSVVLKSESPKRAQKALAVLDNFSQPFSSTDGVSPLVLAVGRLFL